MQEQRGGVSRRRNKRIADYTTISKTQKQTKKQVGCLSYLVHFPESESKFNQPAHQLCEHSKSAYKQQ